MMKIFSSDYINRIEKYMIVFLVIFEGRFINQIVVINLIETETAVYHETTIRHLYIELKYNKFSLNLLRFLCKTITSYSNILKRFSNKTSIFFIYIMI